MTARYFMEFDAWWICKDGLLTCERLYGPFNNVEITLASELNNLGVKP